MRRRPRPAVLCPPSWGERGGERGRVGEQAGGSPPWARAGWSSPSASSGRDRPPGGTRARARGTGVVGRPRWASVRQWSRGSPHHSSPAAGSPAGPCAAPAVAREEPQGLGRKRSWRTCSGPSSSPPTAQPSPGRHGQQPAPPPPSCQGDKLDAQIAHVCWCSANLSPLGSGNNFIACG